MRTLELQSPYWYIRCTSHCHLVCAVALMEEEVRIKCIFGPQEGSGCAPLEYPNRLGGETYLSYGTTVARDGHTHNVLTGDAPSCMAICESMQRPGCCTWQGGSCVYYPAPSLPVAQKGTAHKSCNMVWWSPGEAHSEAHHCMWCVKEPICSCRS